MSTDLPIYIVTIYHSESDSVAYVINRETEDIVSSYSVSKYGGDFASLAIRYCNDLNAEDERFKALIITPKENR